MIDEDLNEYKMDLSEPYNGIRYRYLKLPATKQLPSDHMACRYTDSRTTPEEAQGNVTVSVFDRKCDFKMIIHSFHT